MIATWLLAIAGTIAYRSTGAPWGPGAQVVGSAADFIAPGQIVGSALLLVGSILYTYWAAAFGRISKTEPLLTNTMAQN